MSSSGAGSNPKKVIEFLGVSYFRGEQQILRDISFAVAAGETLVMLGRSGAGKTTALKLVNNLLAPAHGKVVVNGRSTAEWEPIALRRSIGWVIQESGLFPHYTVEQNVALVPKLEQWSRDRLQQRVTELMELVGLDAPLRQRYPHQLSGGQRQRVGVARALAANPQILLMDEPFGALDPITRAELQRQFLALQQRLLKTVVMVTHDLHEALLLATRIALFDEGRLVGIFSKHEFAVSQNPKVREYMEMFQTSVPLI
ncbi:MAG TPA: ATP-binding cassette domain-containing protein [Terriglobales bacterium]|nr:ATP-binding cassette domain-containing protein [Terriglobales bacterium]